MSIGINYDDENDPYFDQPIGYHFDDIEWEHFVLNKEPICDNDQPICKNENYSIYKDTEIRNSIEALTLHTHYIGVTTTEITDGTIINPINVNGEHIIAKNGDIVLYGLKEFIFTNAAWQELCDLSDLDDADEISDDKYDIPDRV